MSKIGLIVAREYTTRVRKKSFIIMTILGPVLICGFLTLAIFLGLQDDGKKKVLVEDPHGVFYGKFKSTDKVSYYYSDHVTDLKDFLKTEYDYMLTFGGANITHARPLLLFRENYPGSRVELEIRQEVSKVYENMRIAEIKDFDIEKYEQIKTPVSLDVKPADTSDKRNRDEAIIGFIMAVLIYMFIFLYGAQVMRGVIEEKSSRVVEVIISSVKPFQLMMGKILGIALVGLTQFLIWVALMFVIMNGVRSFMLAPDKNDPGYQSEQIAGTTASKSVPQQVANDSEVFMMLFYELNYGKLIGLFVFYFLGGYLLYAALFAAIGAAVDNEADTQQFMLPLTIPLVFAFIISQFSLANPESNALTWSSIVPFTSPVSMMVRASMGFEAGTAWHLPLSMVLLVATFIFTTWIAGKIYRTGILMYGKKVTYRELWKWLFYKA